MLLNIVQPFNANLVSKLLPYKIHLYKFLEVFNFYSRVVAAQSMVEENHSLREEDTKWKDYRESSVLKLSSIQQLICSFLPFIAPGSGILSFTISTPECRVCATPDINRKNRRPLFCTQINSCVWKKLGFWAFSLDDSLWYFTSSLAGKWDNYITQIFFILLLIGTAVTNTFVRKLYHNKLKKEMKWIEYTEEKCSMPQYEKIFLKYKLSPRVRNIYFT